MDVYYPYVEGPDFESTAPAEAHRLPDETARFSYDADIQVGKAIRRLLTDYTKPPSTERPPSGEYRGNNILDVRATTAQRELEDIHTRRTLGIPRDTDEAREKMLVEEYIPALQRQDFVPLTDATPLDFIEECIDLLERYTVYMEEEQKRKQNAGEHSEWFRAARAPQDGLVYDRSRVAETLTMLKGAKMERIERDQRRKSPTSSPVQEESIHE